MPTNPNQAAIDRFTAAVESEQERSNCTRRDALATVMRRDPELHRQYIKATNSAAVAADL